MPTTLTHVLVGLGAAKVFAWRSITAWRRRCRCLRIST
jgi:hypothetical protein